MQLDKHYLKQSNGTSEKHHGWLLAGFKFGRMQANEWGGQGDFGKVDIEFQGRKARLMADEQQIEEVAAMMFGASLAFTNMIGRKGWAWDACDEQTKQYWRKIAQYAWNIFNRPKGVLNSNEEPTNVAD